MGFTVLKAPVRLRESSKAIYFLEIYTVQICSISNLSAISMDLSLLAPICVAERRPYFSAVSRSRLAVKASTSLLIIFSRAISHYAPGILYTFFPDLQITIVQVYLNYFE